jgi:nucleoid DNA-binding protein
MKKPAIVRRLARELQIPAADAAEQIDRVVHDIVCELKRGRKVSIPGFGTLNPARSTEKPRGKK